MSAVSGLMRRRGEKVTIFRVLCGVLKSFATVFAHNHSLSLSLCSTLAHHLDQTFIRLRLRIMGDALRIIVQS